LFSLQAKGTVRTPKTGNGEKIKKSPLSSPIMAERGVKQTGSPTGILDRPVKSSTPSPNSIFIPPHLFESEAVSTTLKLIPVGDEPDVPPLESVPFSLDQINGDVIDPPDNNDNDTTNIEDELFRFKKPRLDLKENKENGKERNGNKNADESEFSVSTKSSRAIAIARRKQAEKNIELHTAQGMTQHLIHDFYYSL